MALPEQHNPTIAFRLRYLIALLGIVGFLLAIVGIYGALYDHEVSIALWLGLMLFAQFLLLSPRPDWTRHVATAGRPMRRTVIVAAGMFAILSAGFLATALEVLGKWEDLAEQLLTTELGLVLGGLWIFWTVAFLFVRDRGPRYLRLRRLVTTLLAGSLLESIVAVGVLTAMPDPDDCICARGSFFGLFVAGCVALWAFGPATILVFSERKMQAEFLRRRCDACKKKVANSIRGGFDHCQHCNAPLPQAVAR